MPRWKSTQNLLGVQYDGEVFDPNWMDRDTVQMPPSPLWDGKRPIRFEDVDIWEVICEWSGLSCGGGGNGGSGIVIVRYPI